jgi:purine-binding chemotaxis protein CheW
VIAMPETLGIQVEQTALLATFAVRNALCGLDAAEIQEVIRLGPLTPVRHGPEEVAGILNLRGRIVTILDVGLCIGFPKAVPGGESRIIIMAVRNEFIGLLVDRVDDVVEVAANQWERPPANVSGGQTRFFKAVCRVAGRVITLLDPEQILVEAA